MNSDGLCFQRKDVLQLKPVYQNSHSSIRKIPFFVFLFFLSVLQLIAVEIKGEVLNLEGKPITAVVVLHRESGHKSLTNEKGFFHLVVPDNEKIKLEFIHQDYMEQEIILSNQNLPEKIIVTLVPYIKQKEEIIVTALRYPESSSSIPAAETVIPKETLEEKMAPSITESLVNIPGVSSLGAGGFSLVPNIRGLARRRVLILIDSARVTSDRRTGANASFVAPRNIERIEVLRSPSSVFYGSDAIGGVIHILTKKPNMHKRFEGKVYIKYGSVNQDKSFGFSVDGSRKNSGFYLSFQGNDAENYSSPSGEVLQSQFTQGSLFGKFSHMSEKREIHLSFLGARGYNIGKPNQDSLIKPTWYPLESQNLLQIHWLEKGIGEDGELSFQVYVNPNFLETKKEKIKDIKTAEFYSKTQSLDTGFHLSYGKKIGKRFRINGGADFYGRFSVKAKNSNTSFDPSGNVLEVIEEWPFTKGKRKDYGFYFSVDYFGIKNLDLLGGLRLDFLQMEASPGNASFTEKKKYSAWTGFIGGSFRLSEQIVTFVNLSRAYRAASLSEMFYTGITGRGFIIAQSNLNPETSLNLDAGIKFINKRFFAGFYSFHYEIDDLIERYLISEKTYTYGNVHNGKINGLEIEMEYYPLPGWKIFGNFFTFKGKSSRPENALNDIPSSHLFVGSRIWIGRFSAEINAVFQERKKNPGPAEIEIPGNEVINIKASYLFDSSLKIYFILSNLSNKAYLARPDPDSVEEPGRNFLFGASYSF